MTGRDRDWAPESTEDRGHGYGTDGTQFTGHGVHIAAEAWTDYGWDEREQRQNYSTWAVCGTGLTWRTEPPVEGDGRKWCQRCTGQKPFNHAYSYRIEDLT
jgi:hypothetical protein